MIVGILVGFVAMALLSVIPVLGPVLAGFVAGIIAGGGAGRGSLTGFLAGIFGAILLAVLVTGGFAWFGSLLDMPILGTVLGGGVGVIIVFAGLYEGFLGLIGGAIGGLVRK